jgi:hypothetical protein
MRGRLRGDSSRFQHQDFLAGEPWLIQQRQRNQSGFTRSGRCFEYNLVMRKQGLPEAVQNIFNR